MNGSNSGFTLPRFVWKAIGFLCVGLAAIGVILPLMPTTVFLIIAAYAFARSSPKMHAWLMNNKRFGPMLMEWQNHRAISLRSKIYAIGSMLIIVAISLALKIPVKALILQVLILASVAFFIATRPRPPKSFKAKR